MGKESQRTELKWGDTSADGEIRNKLKQKCGLGGEKGGAKVGRGDNSRNAG